MKKILQVLDAVIQDVADHPEEEVRETTGMGWTVGTQTHSIPLDIVRQTLSEIESPALRAILEEKLGSPAGRVELARLLQKEGRSLRFERDMKAWETQKPARYP